MLLEGRTYLGVDLGASSGRVMAGWLAGDRLHLDEVHRFENNPVDQEGTLCWNIDGLITEIFHGIKIGIATARKKDRPVQSIGIDSWAVDFGLIGEDGQLVGPVVHYRDSRTDGQQHKVFQKVSRERIFEITGIQFLPFNTIYQLAALKEQTPDQLNRARQFIMIADLVAWHLTGNATCEYTNATSTQLFDSRKGTWSEELLSALDLPPGIFPEVVHPGDLIGKLKSELAQEWNAPDIEVVAVATHDTGSAVIGVPATAKPFAYLSCGTWSLLGTEVRQPVITPDALAANFTNEGGAAGTFRFLKNIMGLWILQECRREWQRQGKSYSWDDLTRLAEENATCSVLIDVDDPRFLPPGDMVGRIRDYWLEQRSSVPESEGAIVACILRSLAARYRDVLETIEGLTGAKFPALHMVGGGIKNRLLCQWTAEAIRRPVIAGPAEATVLGNIGIQITKDSNSEADLSTIRQLIKSTFHSEVFHP